MKTKPKNKKKQSSVPSFFYIILALTSGFAMRNASFNVTSYVYLAGFLVIFVMPYLLVLYEGQQEMRQTEELARSLQGE